MNNQIFSLISDIEQSLKQSGFCLSLPLVAKIETSEGFPCVGFFSKEEKTLIVAMMDPNWLFTLVHEYCHFLQDREGLWADDFSCSADEQFEQWLNHKIELDDSLLETIVRTIQACELDCEMMTIKMLNSYQLCYNQFDYIQQANRYIMSYEASRLLRKDVTLTNEAYPLIPTEFITNFKILPSGILQFVKER